jgi:hypothetical protein
MCKIRDRYVETHFACLNMESQGEVIERWGKRVTIAALREIEAERLELTRDFRCETAMKKALAMEDSGKYTEQQILDMLSSGDW